MAGEYHDPLRPLIPDFPVRATSLRVMVPLYPPFRCYDAIARSTVRIDDDLTVELERRARDAGIPLTRMLNRTLRVGLAGPERLPGDARPYKQRTVTMGRPLADLDKALALAAELEHEEAARKLARRG